MRLLASLVLSLSLGSCGFLYTMDVQQGNFVTHEMVAKLKPGMTKNEVRQTLGTPLLRDVFHADRWDYYFSNVKDGRADSRSQLTVVFKDDKLVEWKGGGRDDPRKAAPAKR